MIKRILCLVIPIILCFTLCSCGGVKGADAQIIYPIDNDPKYLDPQIISDIGAKNIILNCFEGLVSLDSDGNIAPGCATDWTVSADELTYTFNLDKNCAWRVSSAAGKLLDENCSEPYSMPLTADDFVFAFRRAVQPETKSPSARNLLSVTNATKVNQGLLPSSQLGVTALGTHTLQITLEKADPDFLYTLLEPACMPCNEAFFKATAGRYGLSTKYLIYNGPFYMNNWADDSSITLRKNTYYRDAESVLPFSIYYSIFNEQSTRLKKLKNETYNVSPLTREQAAQIADKNDYTVHSFESSVLSLMFNCGDEYLQNDYIRKAIVASFDLETIKAELGEFTAKGVLPGSLIIGDSKYREQSRSIKIYENSAPQQLLETGLAQIEKSDAEITILCSTSHEALIRKIMQTWQVSLGIKFNVFVEAVDDALLQSRIVSKDYQLAFAPVTYSSDTAFSGILRYTSDSSDNIVNLNSPMYDSIVEKVKSTSGTSESIDATRQAENYLVTNCVLVPLYEQSVYYGLGKGVSGVIFNNTGEILYFKYTVAK